MHCNTRLYQFAHGKAPRGQGCWFFFPDSALSLDGPYSQISGKFGDAKKQAVAHAKSQGWTYLYVGS